jgi:hypothetical protein
MAQDESQFDERLRTALKRSATAAGATPELRANVSSMLRAGPVLKLADAPKPLPSVTGGRVFGLPRAWGLAAAVAMLVLGGGMLTYQLRDFFPQKQQRYIAQGNLMQKVIDGMVKVHQTAPDAGQASTDLAEFQRSLPTAMPIATLDDSKARLVNASVGELNGRLCYAVRYLVDGKAFTLITANAKIGYYEIPKYNQVESGLRLVGGERNGYLVCLIGESGVAEPTYQSLLDAVNFRPSTSTQPVSSIAGSDGCAMVH